MTIPPTPTRQGTHTTRCAKDRASGAYPLVTPTYILIAQTQKDAATGNELKGWLEWDLASAQQSKVTKLGYAPLPTALISLDLAALKTVH